MTFMTIFTLMTNEIKVVNDAEYVGDVKEMKE